MVQLQKPSSPLSSTAWSLALMGRGHLTRDGVLVPLERKTAAMFAYLALEGPTVRSKIAGLLWPDSTEDAARSSLRQRLYRLRRSSGVDLVVSDEPLRLDASLEVDAVRFESLVFTGEHAKALELEGGLLVGNEYDDCPDLSEWLLAARERLEGARREALAGEANQLEAAGDYGAALVPAERLLARDLVSENAHRRVMRLHYLAGDRPAATRAFERCRAVLERDLGVAPLAETLELARLISSGADLPQAATPRRASIPLEVLRPPVLVGRAGEWARLEAAWGARQVVFIAGSPGAGKTRLMLDFAAHKGALVLFEGRPGDAGVPYSTHARSLQRTFAAHPDLELEPWVRRELSRLAPDLELRLGQNALRPIQSEAEKLRFYEAGARAVLAVAARGARTVVFDDLQFMDSGSVEMSGYSVTKSGEDPSEPSLWPRSLCAYRTGELSSEAEASVRQMVDSGAAILIELEPLGADAVRALLECLGGSSPELAGLERLGEAMARYTGGNPLFVVETVKSLFETGQLAQARRDTALPERLPPPGRIGPLIRRRLERLSPGAVRLARVAAVAGTDFTLELAASVLEVNALGLVEEVDELESAQVMRDERFTHELILEATLEGLPNTIQLFLHRRTAEYLETAGAEPARVASHWLEGGNETKAAPHLLEGARLAQNAFQHREATGLFERAAAILEAHGEATRAFDALYEAASLLQEFDPDERMMTIERGLFRLKSGPLQDAKALVVRAARLLAIGRSAEAEPIFKTALERATEAEDETMQGEAVYGLGVTLYYASRAPEALGFMRRALEIRERVGNLENVLVSQHSLALTLGMLGHRSEAASLLGQVLTTEFNTGVMGIQSVNTLIQIAVLDAERGWIRQAIPSLLEARAKLETLDGSHHFTALCLASLANCWGYLGEYQSAFEGYARLFGIPPKVHPELYALAHARLGMAYLEVGQDARSEAEIEIAETLLEGQARFREMLKLARARLGVRRGQPSAALFEEAERALEQDGNGLSRCTFLIARATTLAPNEAIADAEHALEIARSEELDGLARGAHARLAQAYLGLGQASKALEHGLEATRGLEDLTCTVVSRAELLFTHFRALEANADPESHATLERALAWLLEIADHHVPPEYRQSFLTHNLVNREILEAAHRHGLPTP